MKKTSLLFFMSVMIAFMANGQDIDSVTLSKLKLNFTVPDMPAFKVLGTDPSNLLRPSTPQALAVSISSFSQRGEFVVPEALAVEISPSLLLNANKAKPQELEHYAKNKVTNSIRVSLGSSTDTSLSLSGRNLGLGFRISFINEGDLATDRAAHREISTLLKEFRENVRNISMSEFAVLNNIDTSVEDWDTVFNAGGSMKAQFDEYLENEGEESQKIFTQKLNKFKDDYKRENWNADKLDFALAILSSSPDSLVKNIRFNRAELWLTGAIKTGKNSQLMLGLNAQLFKNLKDNAEATRDKNYFDISVPARYLIGTNRVKGFAEAQYNYNSTFKDSKVLVNLGAELNIVDGLWVNLYGGIDYNTSESDGEFVTNLNIKLTLPEKFEFF